MRKHNIARFKSDASNEFSDFAKDHVTIEDAHYQHLKVSIEESQSLNWTMMQDVLITGMMHSAIKLLYCEETQIDQTEGEKKKKKAKKTV